MVNGLRCFVTCGECIVVGMGWRENNLLQGSQRADIGIGDNPIFNPPRTFKVTDPITYPVLASLWPGTCLLFCVNLHQFYTAHPRTILYLTCHSLQDIDVPFADRGSIFLLLLSFFLLWLRKFLSELLIFIIYFFKEIKLLIKSAIVLHHITPTRSHSLLLIYLRWESSSITEHYGVKMHDILVPNFLPLTPSNV